MERKLTHIEKIEKLEPIDVTEKIDYQSVTFTGKMVPKFSGALGKIIPIKKYLLKYKVKIYTFADKAPHFIPWQAKSFKMLKDDYELIVMNNSSSVELDKHIKNHCLSLGIKCIDVEKKDHSHGVFACSAPIQECIDNYISKDKENISVIIDSDMFLMREFSFNELVFGYDIVGIPQSRDLGGGFGIIEYLWNCLLVFNTTAPNLDKFKMFPGTINHAPGDVGAMSYFYLLYNDVKLRRIGSTGIITNHPEHISLFPEHIRSNYREDFHMEIIESFLHMRGGSRWNNRPKKFYEDKEEFIRKMVEHEA